MGSWARKKKGSEGGRFTIFKSVTDLNERTQDLPLKWSPRGKGKKERSEVFDTVRRSFSFVDDLGEGIVDLFTPSETKKAFLDPGGK